MAGKLREVPNVNRNEDFGSVDRCSRRTILLSAVSQAQVYYGTIRGTVLDLSGGVMPSVEVVITNVGTNIGQRVASNEVGNYVAPNLIPGIYRVTAERPDSRGLWPTISS